MDNFKAIYKILKILEKAMDIDEFGERNIRYSTMVIKHFAFAGCFFYTPK